MSRNPFHNMARDHHYMTYPSSCAGYSFGAGVAQIAKNPHAKTGLRRGKWTVSDVVCEKTYAK